MVRRVWSAAFDDEEPEPPGALLVLGMSLAALVAIGLDRLQLLTRRVWSRRR